MKNFIGGYLMVGLYKFGVIVVDECLFENVYYIFIDDYGEKNK